MKAPRCDITSQWRLIHMDHAAYHNSLVRHETGDNRQGFAACQHRGSNLNRVDTDSVCGIGIYDEAEVLMSILHVCMYTLGETLTAQGPLPVRLKGDSSRRCVEAYSLEEQREPKT